MLDRQRAAGLVSGDHFAKPGANDRIWGALDKLALAHLEVFFDYYANDIVALAPRARLGPNYQVTSALTSSTPAGRRSPRTVTITWVSCRWRPRPTIRSTCTACPRCSPCKVPWRTATCGGNRAHDVSSALAEVRTRLRGGRPAGIRRVFRPKLRAIALGHARWRASTGPGHHRPLRDPGGPQQIRCVDDRDRQCDSRFGGRIPVSDQPRPTSTWISRSAA